jgi:hypothetical protein
VESEIELLRQENKRLLELLEEIKKEVIDFNADPTTEIEDLAFYVQRISKKIQKQNKEIARLRSKKLFILDSYLESIGTPYRVDYEIAWLGHDAQILIGIEPGEDYRLSVDGGVSWTSHKWEHTILERIKSLEKFGDES